MQTDSKRLSAIFVRFFDSEKTSGVLLLGGTVISLLLANSSLGTSYVHLWELQVGGVRIEQWINEGLMAIFFLLIGLELERELCSGELSDPRRALLTALAALRGMVVPAAIYYLLNALTRRRLGSQRSRINFEVHALLDSVSFFVVHIPPGCGSRAACAGGG
jgi:NhaA family Na+:H+ antiporter